VIKPAVETGTSRAAYLDGPPGSGKSHFMAVLYAILKSDPDARGKKGLADIAARHDPWLKNRRFFLVPYHPPDLQSLDATIMGGCADHVLKEHPGRPLPAVYCDGELIADTKERRQQLGDDAFIAQLGRSPVVCGRLAAPHRSGGDGYPVNMDVAGAAVVWTPYQARPGRRVLVVKDLADLRGPASGTVTLPLRLFWSPPGRVFDLDDPFMLRSMYQIVLGEAIRAEELTTYLNRDTLVAVWRDLYLPKGVRRAWEELHPALHATAPARAG
jgi:hypothetical protein